VRFVAIRQSLHVCVSLILSKPRRLETCCAILRWLRWAYTKVATAWPFEAEAKLQKVTAVTAIPHLFWQVAERRGHRTSRRALSMRYEQSNKNTPRQPLCPGCAQVMRLVRVTSRFDELPDLYTFECRACGLSHIEAAWTGQEFEIAPYLCGTQLWSGSWSGLPFSFAFGLAFGPLNATAELNRLLLQSYLPNADQVRAYNQSQDGPGPRPHYSFVITRPRRWGDRMRRREFVTSWRLGTF